MTLGVIQIGVQMKRDANQERATIVQGGRDAARTLARKLQAQLTQKRGEPEELEAAVQAARHSSRGGGKVA